MGIDQAVYVFFASVIQNEKVCRGRVLNVGLGQGHSARLFAASKYIDSVVSIEKDWDVIERYRTRFNRDAPDAVEACHSIIHGEASTVLKHPASGMFSFAYMDILTDYTAEVFEAAKAVLTAMRPLLSGPACIQWWGEHELELDLRRWLQNHDWQKEVLRPALAARAVGSAAEITIYHP